MQELGQKHCGLETVIRKLQPLFIKVEFLGHFEFLFPLVFSNQG